MDVTSLGNRTITEAVISVFCQHSFWYSDFLLLLSYCVRKEMFKATCVIISIRSILSILGCFTLGARNKCECMCAAHRLTVNRTGEILIINDHMQLVGCSDLWMYPTSTVKLQLQCGSHVTILLDHILAFLLSSPNSAFKHPGTYHSLEFLSYSSCNVI